MNTVLFKPGEVSGYDDLDTLADANYAATWSYVQQFIIGGPPLNTQPYEANHPFMTAQAAYLAPLMDFDHSAQMRDLARQGYYLGVLISQKLSPSVGWEKGLDAYQELPEIVAQKQILEATADYMQPRRHLGMLVTHGVDALERRWKYRESIKTITSLVCMHVELQQYERFIEEESAKFSSELSKL